LFISLFIIVLKAQYDQDCVKVLLNSNQPTANTEIHGQCQKSRLLWIHDFRICL